MDSDNRSADASPRTSPQASVQVRGYDEHDAATTLGIFIAAVMQTAAADYTPEQVQAWARPEQRDPANWNLAMLGRNSFVATIAGEVVGFSDVADNGYIDMMFVSPRQLRKGVARRLLAEAETQARATHIPALYADVSITARPFFESNGFLVEREQHPVRLGVSLTNFRMQKSLG